MFRGPRVEVVVACRNVQRRNPVEKIHCVDHLHALPELAFQRRVQEITAVQDVYIVSLLLQLPDRSVR